MFFKLETGEEVLAVTTQQMREVDRAAVEDFGYDVLQMMENAGRSLSLIAMDMLAEAQKNVTILAGGGGNGGGGLCCARHLLNHGFDVKIVLNRDIATLKGSAAIQLNVLQAGGLAITNFTQASRVINNADLIVDALVGYGLNGIPVDQTHNLIQMANQSGRPVLSLDVPSGMDANTGTNPGEMIHALSTVTLALPKIGLGKWKGRLFLADIGIPKAVYLVAGIRSVFDWNRQFINRIYVVDG